MSSDSVFGGWIFCGSFKVRVVSGVLEVAVLDDSFWVDHYKEDFDCEELLIIFRNLLEEGQVDRLVRASKGVRRIT